MAKRFTVHSVGPGTQEAIREMLSVEKNTPLWRRALNVQGKKKGRTLAQAADLLWDMKPQALKAWPGYLTTNKSRLQVQAARRMVQTLLEIEATRNPVFRRQLELLKDQGAKSLQVTKTGELIATGKKPFRFHVPTVAKFANVDTKYTTPRFLDKKLAQRWHVMRPAVLDLDAILKTALPNKSLPQYVRGLFRERAGASLVKRSFGLEGEVLFIYNTANTLRRGEKREIRIQRSDTLDANNNPQITVRSVPGRPQRRQVTITLKTGEVYTLRLSKAFWARVAKVLMKA